MSSGRSTMEIQAREIIRLRDRRNQIFVRHTGQPLERIVRDTDRDFFMNGEQAVEYGLADEVLTPQRLAVAAGR